MKKLLANKYFLILFLIILFAAWLRFWGYPTRYGFDIDATRDALITQYAVSSHMLPLVGPVSSLGSFTFGPWYYYQLIVFQYIVPVTYSPWIYISLISLLTIVVMYLIGKSLINRKFALLLAFLTSIAPGQLIAGTGLSNPDLVSLFAALALWLFILLLKSETPAWIAFLFGLAIGIGVNEHYQMIYFVLLPLLLLLRKNNKVNVIVFSFVGIFVSFIPLLYFNLTHNWQTVSGLLDYYIYGKNKVYFPNSWTIYLLHFWPSFWGYVFGLPSVAGLVITISSLALSIFLIIKKKVTLSYILLFSFFMVCFLFLRYFSGERVSYYLLFLHPFLILFTGLLFWYVLKLPLGKIVLGILLLIVSYYSIKTDISRMGAVDSHIQFLNEARLLQTLYPRKDFSFFACAGQYRNQIQGLVFLISNSNRLGKGVKIGFSDSHCKYPPNLIENEKLKTLGAVDLSNYSVEELGKYGWTLISPEYVYISSLK
ncbi:MAG TPA: glycosyltransferase family 39 protein [Patescibacteria group bacterium]|nr:glycosyltransferase family 39 protein [Patescibacteria group bacterium]